MGPFYCPIDKKVYLDTSFFRDMKTKYGGGGDFAYSYVVAHEIGHHVQDVLGILDKVDNLKQQVSQTQANALSVRVELQADCFAGVWANHANAKWKILEPGDIEKAMATAEIGHHVQDLLGILDKVDNLKQQVSQTQANALSVRVELQADCLAGVWANHANAKWKILEPGDIERAMATAAAIGDDRLQTAARGYAVPDSFTHGSSAMRQQWLTTGLKSGDINSCNTFSN